MQDIIYSFCDIYTLKKKVKLRQKEFFFFFFLLFFSLG